MPDRAIRLALLQMSATGNPADNPDRILAAMRTAKAKGADLLVTPELALAGYGNGDNLVALAQPAGGAWQIMLEQAARETGISLVAGFPERDGTTTYISAMMIDCTGHQATRIYRKACLYGPYENARFQSAGPSTITMTLNGLNLGCLICYDVEFPENVRRLALAGVDLVVVPTAMAKGADGTHIASRVIPVRAFENQVFVAYANYADSDSQVDYQGLSSIAAPDGTSLATGDISGESLLIADIAPANYAKSHADNPYLRDVKSLTM